MATLSFTYSQGCTSTGGTIALESVSLPPAADADASFSWAVVDSMGTDLGGAFDQALLPSLSSLANGIYTVRVFATDSSTNYTSIPKQVTVSCSTAPDSLHLDQLQLTEPTVPSFTGHASITVSGGTAPVVVTGIGSAAEPTTAQPGGAALYVSGELTAGDYVATFTDSSTPALTLDVPFTLDSADEPVGGCTDEYALDYDPAAGVLTSCTYGLTWRSAWAPGRMPVRVPALPGQTAAFTRARLRIGFRLGHPLAADRPLGAPQELTATVGPDGFATFRLGPYLRSALGGDDSEGGRRLDLNSPTATTADLFVGYELRRLTGELLEHGYALNAAVPDEALVPMLSPFAGRLPTWPGFDEYLVPSLNSANQDKYGVLTEDHAYQYDGVRLPCPANPLPVAWLAPGGGFGYWVFQGRPQLGDEVGDGSTYQEPESGERRYSSRGDAHRTITASSGVFKGADLMEGLRTLWRSPQVWYMPNVASGVWVPVTLEPGSFPAGRLGVARQQVSISFTHAAPEWAQGQ